MWKRSGRSICRSIQNLRGSLAGWSPFADRSFWLFLTILSLTGYWLTSRIVISISPSLDHRIFLLNRSGREPGKGEYVIFRFSSPLLKQGKPQRVIKEVTCMAGETLSVDTGNRFFYCNGKYLGMAKPVTLKGAGLPVFVFNGRIPKGRLFVSGRHRDSFDSRYWGFLDARDVRGIATPLF